MVDVLYRDESYKIMGACFEVHNEMGCEFLEPEYQECLDRFHSESRYHSKLIRVHSRHSRALLFCPRITRMDTNGNTRV